MALGGGGDASVNGIEGLMKSRFVTEDFLTVLGIPLIHGRPIPGADRSCGPQGAIVNEAFAPDASGV